MWALTQARSACKTAYQMQQPAQNKAQHTQRDINSTMDYIILQKFAMPGYLLLMGAPFNLRPSPLVPSWAILQPCLCLSMYPLTQTQTRGLYLPARPWACLAATGLPGSHWTVTDPGCGPWACPLSGLRSCQDAPCLVRPSALPPCRHLQLLAHLPLQDSPALAAEGLMALYPSLFSG